MKTRLARNDRTSERMRNSVPFREYQNAYFSDLDENQKFNCHRAWRIPPDYVRPEVADVPAAYSAASRRASRVKRWKLSP